jgi:hypothetical protein
MLIDHICTSKQKGWVNQSFEALKPNLLFFLLMQLVEWCLPNFNVRMNHLRILLKCRFWLGCQGWSKSLHLFVCLFITGSCKVSRLVLNSWVGSSDHPASASQVAESRGTHTAQIGFCIFFANFQVILDAAGPRIVLWVARFPRASLQLYSKVS